jgi:RNA polymerase sigma-70 factor, ECF subfamily
MFGVEARDLLDVTGCAVSHPGFMSTSNDVLVVEPGDPAASPRRLASARNRRDATPREADASLMAALLRKEPAAADALYRRYASRIYGLGLVLLRNKADAQDLVQDTFLKVWRTGSAFDPRRGSLDGWILLTARSLAIDLLRRRSLETRKLASEPSVSDVSEEPGPEWHAERRDLIQRVLEAMNRLPPRQRSAVALAYLGEHSSTQVAELQGIPPGTVKSRIRAGMETLRRTLVEVSLAHPTTDLREQVERFERSRGAGS